MSDGPNTETWRLKAFVERIERLEEEKAALAADIKEVYGEAKGAAFDVKALREIIRLRKQDREERERHERIVDDYRAKLGMLADTPLGQAAIQGAA